MDFSKGMPPRLAIGHRDSAGETVQRMLPDSKVVKAFNIVGLWVTAGQSSYRRAIEHEFSLKPQLVSQSILRTHKPKIADQIHKKSDSH